MTDSTTFDEASLVERVEIIIRKLKQIEPTVEVRRLEWSAGLAGDTLVWYFTHPNCPFEVQVDPALDGLFITGTDEKPGYTKPTTYEEAIEVVLKGLHLRD